MKIIALLLIGLIKIYRLLISPFFSSSCRFAPTCSQYALDGIRKDGIYAIGKIIKRISSCHPWGKSGFNPYISKNSNNQSKAEKD